MIAARDMSSVGRGWSLLGVLVGVVVSVLMFSAGASASFVWRLTGLSNTVAQPGRQFELLVEVANTGDEFPSGAPYTLTARLPAGMSGVSVVADPNPSFGIGSVWDCPGLVGASVIRCTSSSLFPGPHGLERLKFTVDVAPGAGGVRTVEYAIEGGGAMNAPSTVDPVRVSSDPVSYGVDAFDGRVDADDVGTPLTQAGGHPFVVSTSFDVNTRTDPNPGVGQRSPVEAAKDVVVDLPPGFIGNPTAATECTAPELANAENVEPLPLCAPTSQVGTAMVRHGDGVVGPVPVFNMVPPPNAPARFGFDVAGTVVVLDGSVRSSDYGVTVVGSNISEGLAILGTTITFWGVPSADIHDTERACPGQRNPWAGGPVCDSGAPSKAFFRNPTSCPSPGVGLVTRLRTDSWANPGVFKEASFTSHLPVGYPFAPVDWGLPQGPEGCAAVPFRPTFDAQPLAGSRAASPASMVFDITVPQSDDPASIGQSDLKRASVTLPEGVRVSPSSANGLGACSSAQIGLGRDGDPSCPDASKLGTVTIDTPLLREQVKGSVYLAKPFDNPFDALIAIYLVARARGVVLKLPGQVSLNPATGQITTTFDNNPQLPFTRLHLEFDTGPRTPLTMPQTCGTFTTHAVLEGWNGSIVPIDSSFALAQNGKGQPCPPQFSPGFTAGTESSSAGTSSTFHLRLTRQDEDQQIKGVTVNLPRGLTGNPSAVNLCSEAAARTSSCPETSRVGDVTVGAGAGSSPFFITTGRAYFTGPYKGAPFGLEIVVPAVAGPFDLGNVTVRQALYIDKHDATVRVISDPLPTILQGIPLDVRDIRVDLNRNGFIVNPASCAEKRITGTIESVAGAQAAVSDRFQAADCGSRPLPPKQVLNVGAVGHTGRNAVVPFSTTLTMPKGSTNLRFVRVTLPKTINARLTVINRACTRVQYEAGRCEAARAGTAVAKTPLLRDPLRGNVYFVKNGHPLPDLFVALRGQVEFDLIGRITIPQSKYLATTFDAIPDVPVTSFTLSLVSGAKGSVGAATNLCTRRARAAKAELDFIGQNGKVKQIDQRLSIRGCGKQAKKARRAGRRR